MTRSRFFEYIDICERHTDREILKTMLLRPSLIIGFLAAAVVMGAIHRRLSSSGSFFAILYCLPFTIMHETAHFTVALLTGGRPSSFSVWPRREGNRWVLGSVTAVPTVISAVPTALAPLGWLVIGYYVIVLWNYRPVWVPEYLIIVVLYACTAACTPSWRDIRVALTHPVSLLVWGGGGYAVWRMYLHFSL